MSDESTQPADQAGATAADTTAQKLPAGPLPIRMLSDRLLVMLDAESAERRSAGGILIPATASVGKRLAWAHVVAIGAHVRQVALRDRVLFDPADKAEVELDGRTYLLLRERDVAGVAQTPAGPDSGGMYL
jgi:chaperonin GroES